MRLSWHAWGLFASTPVPLSPTVHSPGAVVHWYYIVYSAEIAVGFIPLNNFPLGYRKAIDIQLLTHIVSLGDFTDVITFLGEVRTNVANFFDLTEEVGEGTLDCNHVHFVLHDGIIAQIHAEIKRPCASLPNGTRPGRLVRLYYAPLYLHPLDLLYLKVRLMGHNVINAVIHINAIFNSNELQLLRLFVFEDNGECHCRSIKCCSRVWRVLIVQRLIFP